jgi:glucose-1-phosphate cytidylyltransferase
MKTVILCGGLGTRMREETEYRPKPLVDIGGRPILWHIMKLFAHHGHQDFVLCLGYRAEMIKDYFLNYEALNNDFTLRLGRSRQIEYHGAHGEQDFQVTLVDTGLATQTGGRIAKIERFLGEDPLFFATYGDGVADIDLQALLRFHRGHGKIATVTAVRPTSRFGVLEIGAEGEVENFREKPTVDGWVSAGFFVFDRRIFDYLGSEDCVLETGPVEQLVGEGQLRAFRHQGFFFAIDTYREYKMINAMYDRGERPWQVW